MTDHSFWQEQRQEANQDALPRRAPDRIWAGPATKARCAMCGASTKDGEKEVEIEYGLDDHSGTKTYYLHARCFFILERGHWNLD
jgi:hypothetical protein